MIPEPASSVQTLKKYLAERAFGNELLYQKAGIELAGPERCRRVLGLPPDPYDKRIGIIFHYPAIPGEEPYATVRWFGRYVGAFGQVADNKLQCPAGRPVRAYVSPLADLEQDGAVYICESVLKALVLSTTGRYAVGGNGVSCFFVRGDFVPGFPIEAIDRAGRVVILFDNDVKTNPSVAAARRRLTEGLRGRWPNLTIQWGDLPDPPDGGKWGLDDAIASGWNPDTLAVEDASATDLERTIDELNELYCVCEYPPCIIKKDTGRLYSRADFTGIMEAHRKVWIGEKPVEASRVWLAAEERSIVPEITYKPGAEKFVEKQFYNLWLDDGVPAVEGDVSPFVRVYENAIPDDRMRGLLFKSVGWMMQNRGKRLEKTFVFVSRQVGTGKSLFAVMLSRILGMRNAASIDMTDFASDFNAVYAAKELVVIDDLHKVSKNEVAKLRRYTTSPRIVVNEKNVKRYEIDNTAVFILTTNELSAIPMDDEERRNLVVAFEPKVHYTGDTDWWKSYVSWLEGGGYGHLRWWFEHMDLTDFDPYYTPPMNDIKSKMVAQARGPEDNFAFDLLHDPDTILGPNKRSVYTTEELWFIFSGGPPGPGDLLKFGKALGNKFSYANEGKLGRYFAGQKACRMWAIRKGSLSWSIEQIKEDVKAYPSIVAS